MKIPPLGLGTWRMRGSQCEQAVRLALEIGYRLIDTATVYENEAEVGKAIGAFPREQLFLTSKLWRDIEDPSKVEAVCNASLKALKTSYLDLYLLHWAHHKTFIDLLDAMEKLKTKGKVREIGISNATIHHLEDALRAKLPIKVNQVECHPFFNQKELLDFCLHHNIQLEAYYPLARGEVYKNTVLMEIGKKYQKTAGQVVLRWFVQKGIVPIPKASSEAHLRENFEIFDFKLTKEEVSEIDNLNENRRIGNPEWNDFSY